MGDEYIPRKNEMTIYPVGLRAGDLLRIKQEVVVRDHEDQPTGEVYPVGEVWRVVPGSVDEPHVIWLEQADGRSHTWDEDDLFETFERVPELS